MLAAIWQRLRETPLGAAVTLRSRRRTLLDQTWDIWRVRTGSVTVMAEGGRRLRARHLASGLELTISPREAEVVRQMMASGRGLPNLHAALGLSASIAGFGGDHAAVVQALERLHAAGLMEKVAVPEDGA